MISIDKSLEYFSTLQQPYSYDDQQRWNKFITYHCPTIKETDILFSKIRSHLKRRRVKKYFLTLTTNKVDIFSLYNRLKYISRRFKGKVASFCIELTLNGQPHIHAIFHTCLYIRQRDIYKANGSESVKCDLMKTDADVNRVIKYMLKEQESEKMLKYLEKVKFEKPINYIH